MPTSTFSPNDNTKVALIGRWTYDGTRMICNSHAAEARFSFTGTDLQFNHSATGAAAIDVSIDGGAYTGIVTTNTTSKTLVTIATGLSDAVHTCSVRVNASYALGGFRWWVADGISVTGAAPAIAIFPNHDTTGLQHILYTDTRIVHNLADATNNTLNWGAGPPWPRTSTANHKDAKLRFVTDGEILWVFSHADGFRCYIDGFANEEKVYTVPSGSSTLQLGWHSFTLPNDGAMHEICVVGSRSIDSVMVKGGTGIFESSFAAGLRQCRVAFVGDSVTSGDSASPYTNPSASLTTLAELALPGRFTAFNRGLSGDNVTAWLAAGKHRTEIMPIQPDVVVCFLGVNDMASLTSDAARDAKRDEYIVMYSEILKVCPKASLYQFQINPDHSIGVSTTYNRVVQAQQDAITSVAASYPSRTVQFIAANASWTYGPGSPTAGFTRAGSHPFPSGNCYGMGKNHASIVLSANPSGGDSITATVGGTSYTFTFNAGSHGASPNPVTIGAAVSDTITNLKNVMLSVLGRANMVAWTNDSTAGYFVGVRNCTAISDTGSNVYTYRLSVNGFADMLDPLVPSAPLSALSYVIGG